MVGSGSGSGADADGAGVPGAGATAVGGAVNEPPVGDGVGKPTPLVGRIVTAGVPSVVGAGDPG